MPAFLKRRWILLSCAAVLLACSVVNWFPSYWAMPPGSVGFCVMDGSFSAVMLGYPPISSDHLLPSSLHAPTLGTKPEFESGTATWVSCPLWLPLSVILAWIVILELRWREKRARKVEQP